MQATQVLRREHDLIERVLGLLADTCDRLDRGERVPEEFFSWVVEFIRDFADGSHHHKEEEVLFPLLESRGIPREGGPIGCMLHEHELGRDCVRRMREALLGPMQIPQFVAAARDYVVLLHQHIFKENNVLFAMAERCLSTDDDLAAAARYQTMEPQERQGQVDQQVARWEQALATLASPAKA